MRIDGPLDDLLATRSHIRVLRALARLPDGFSASARELGRRAGIAHPTASRVLASLLEQGVVVVERTPRADLFGLNRDHVLVEQVLALFGGEEALRDDLVSFLRGALERHAPFVTTAVLFGSVVQGEMEPGSDIDLAVACDAGWVRDVEEALQPVEDQVRRRFGNRLSVIAGEEPAADLAKPGRAGVRLWRQILREGIVVLPSGEVHG